MDRKLFFTGVSILILSCLIYRNVKNEKPSSEDTNWNGPTFSTYIGLWSSVVMCYLVGIAFILQSLPSQI